MNSPVPQTPAVSIFTLNICVLLLLSFSPDTKQMNSQRQFCLRLIQNLSQLAQNTTLKAFPLYSELQGTGIPFPGFFLTLGYFKSPQRPHKLLSKERLQQQQVLDQGLSSLDKHPLIPETKEGAKAPQKVSHQCSPRLPDKANINFAFLVFLTEQCL